MEKISISYHDKVFDFIYYSTTLKNENILFIATMDKEAVAMLRSDHFFMTMDIRNVGSYFFNVIENAEDEKEFKEHVAETIMITRFLRIPTPTHN